MTLAATGAPHPEPEEARCILVERTIAAPRELVFSVFTTAEHLDRWWGPDGFSTTTSAFDFRPGGVWRFVMHGPDGRDYQNQITFDEIDPPSRITWRHGGGGDAEPVQFNTCVTFEAEGKKTRITWLGVFPSIAERDRVVREFGAEEGASQTVGRLAGYLAELG
jgi:uncharacterized protein YndB with AHSA1/START domain